MLLSFDIELIRHKQKQRRIDEACRASPTCFWSRAWITKKYNPISTPSPPPTHTHIHTDHLLGKELFIRSTVRVFRERLSIFVCSSFPFGLGRDVRFNCINS